LQYNNILIIKLSAIGDVIHALPVAHALKKCNPKAHITWVVEKPAYDLLTNNSDIDEIILFEKPKFKTLKGLLKNLPGFARILRRQKFDLVIDLQGLFKSAAIAWLTGAPSRIGYCNMRELSSLVSTPVCGKHCEGHVVDRYLDVPRHLGCTVDEVVFPVNITELEAWQTEQIAAEAGLDMSNPYVVLAPGTNWASKCWPTAHFAILTDLLWSDGIIPVVSGGLADAPSAQEISALAKKPPLNVTGKTSLKHLAYLLKKAKAFVGGDTGPMHLAVAVGCPVVTMFGPTDPARNGPYCGNNIVLEPDRNCLHCWEKSCDKDCLAVIDPYTVFAAVRSVMKS